MTINEEDRIRNAYRKRERLHPNKTQFFGYEDLAHLFRVQERYRETLRLLNKHGFQDLSKISIIDIGCGDGNMLRQFMQWGASPANLAGIELRPDQVEIALNLSPQIDVRCGNAAVLPWPDLSFTLVCQNTVFTSILDSSLKKKVASEMDRVLKPGGAVLWYDFIYNNPKNPDVLGVKLKEILGLFTGYQFFTKRITLAPPLSRRIPESLLSVIYPILSVYPFLCTHLLGLLFKPNQ